MLDDCTAIVTTIPTTSATSPPALPRIALRDLSIRAATSAFMFRVTKASATRTIARPVATMRAPLTLPDAPNWSHMSFSHPTGSLTHFLTGLFHSVPPEPTRSSLTHFAMPDIGLKISSIGSKIETAKTLKKSWTVAAANARLNSADWRTCPNETSVLVTVVPMLAPMTIGTACSTPSAPEATNPTMTEVLADDDWTRTVPRMPTHSPAMGLLTAEKRRSWVSAPMILMPASREETPTRNR